MNHFISKLFANEGIGVLSVDKFIFLPNDTFGIKRKSIGILLKDISSLREFGFLSISIGFEIATKSGTVERFAVDSKTHFYLELENAVKSISNLTNNHI